MNFTADVTSLGDIHVHLTYCESPNKPTNLSVEFPNLLNGEYDFTLVQGENGKGKSFLFKQVLYDWWVKSKWQNFDLVFSLNFHDLMDKNYTIPDDILLLNFPKVFEKIEISQLSLFKVLILIDGLDEIFRNNNSNDYTMFTRNSLFICIVKLIQPGNKNLFNRKVLISGRPQFIETIFTYFQMASLQVINIDGFNSKGINRYIKEFTKQHTVHTKDLQSYIEKANIFSNTPQILKLLCNTNEIFDQAPNSLAELYFRQFYCYLEQHFYLVYRKCSTLSKYQIPSVKKFISMISNLAFTSYLKHVITEHDYKGFEKPDLEKLEMLGLLRKLPKQYRTYVFIDSTMQDFLVAVYLFQHNDENNSMISFHKDSNVFTFKEDMEQLRTADSYFRAFVFNLRIPLKEYSSQLCYRNMLQYFIAGVSFDIAFAVGISSNNCSCLSILCAPIVEFIIGLVLLKVFRWWSLYQLQVIYKVTKVIACYIYSNKGGVNRINDQILVAFNLNPILANLIFATWLTITSDVESLFESMLPYYLLLAWNVLITAVEGLLMSFIGFIIAAIIADAFSNRANILVIIIIDLVASFLFIYCIDSLLKWLSLSFIGVDRIVYNLEIVDQAKSYVFAMEIYKLAYPVGKKTSRRSRGREIEKYGAVNF